MSLFPITFLGFSMGAIISRFFSHPNSWFHHKLPRLKIWKIQILPNFKVQGTSREIHIHHWVYWGGLLAFLFYIGEGMVNTWFAKTALFGFVSHGFTYKDRLQFFKQKKQ